MSAVLESPEVRLIQPVKRRVFLRDMRTTWPVTKTLALRDYTLTFKQTALGPVWLFLQPVTLLVGFTVVFGSIADVKTGKIPYALYSLVGITVYGFVQLALGFGVRTFIANKALIQYVACPRLALVNTKVLTSLVQPLLMIVIGTVVIAIAGYGPPVQILAMPLLLAWLTGLIWALMLGLGAANVRFRDVAALLPYSLQAAMLLSPIAYPLDKAPDQLRWLFDLNPLTGIVEAWRWSMLGTSPDLVAIGVALALSVLAALGAWQLFVRMEVRFSDVV
jgi:lipopolysaccharide transport system permease protein